MTFLALFTPAKQSSSSSPKTSKQQRRDRRSRAISPPCIAPRESSLYTGNFAAAASVSCLPLYGGTPNGSSFALASPRPQTDYGGLASRNYSTVEVSRVPEHSPSPYQSFTLADDNQYTPRFAIPAGDFAAPESVSLTRRSPLKTKKWASQSVIGLVKRRMNGNKSRDELTYAGDVWPQDSASQYPEEQDDMVPPPVPSKSALRASTMFTMPAVYHLPVDAPRDTTPSLSSASSDDGETQTSPDIRTPAVSSDRTWGRKKRQDARDPHKIRDGAPRKESSSGVYTPTTFPGARGPRPSHFPTHVYTPTEYPGPAGPSRSSSMSSASGTGSDGSSPRTPQSAIPPRWSSMSSMSNLTSGFRRISTTFASLDPRQTGWHSSTSGSKEPAFPLQPPSPDMQRVNAAFSVVDPRNTTWDAPAPRQAQSAKGSYFPTISSPANFTHARTTSWAGPNGSALGFDMPPPPPRPNRASRFSISEIKRKPVPKVDDVQVEIEKLDIIDREDSRTPTRAV